MAAMIVLLLNLSLNAKAYTKTATIQIAIFIIIPPITLLTNTLGLLFFKAFCCIKKATRVIAKNNKLAIINTELFNPHLIKKLPASRKKELNIKKTNSTGNKTLLDFFINTLLFILFVYHIAQLHT